MKRPGFQQHPSRPSPIRTGMLASLLALVVTGVAYAATASAPGPDWTTIKAEILENAVEDSTTSFRSLKSNKKLDEPGEIVTPEGYQLAFGPSARATTAPGYMGVVFLDTYDTAACASACNHRGFDEVGGLCQFFNIYQADVTHENKTTFACSMYYLPTDNSTATNHGDLNVAISNSRGYKHLPIIPGQFEDFVCVEDPGNFCNTTSFDGWVGTADGNVSASSVAVIEFASFGHHPFAGSGMLIGGSIGLTVEKNISGTMTFRNIPTVKGRRYSLGTYVLPFGAILQTLWNGVAIDQVSLPSGSLWAFRGYTLTALGNDTLAFRGENTTDGRVYVDDVFLFLLDD